MKINNNVGLRNFSKDLGGALGLVRTVRYAERSIEITLDEADAPFIRRRISQYETKTP